MVAGSGAGEIEGGKGMEFGIGTRRRPIGRDYAAAKDAECGMKRIENEKVRR
jgi:hypothetical protein